MWCIYNHCVVEVERLQSQQIKIIHEKCMLRCKTIPLIGEALLRMLEMELEDQMPSLMQDPVGVRKIRWNVVPAENSQGTAQWK